MGNPNVVVSFCRMRCPHCRTAFVFRNKSVLPLKQCVDLIANCTACGQKLLLETNNGGGINYAITIMLLFLNALWYWPIFGLSYKDNSFFYFIATSITVVIAIQPWLSRYSRMIFLYFIVTYDKDWRSAAV